MRLHVIGKGVVGAATGSGFHRFGHEVVYTDRGDSHAVEADIHFICTPEDAVPQVVQELAEKLTFDHGMNGQVVIRSSVPPGTTEALANTYPRLRLFHNPEFLREAVAESDFLHADRAIIGSAYGGPCYALDALYGEMQVPVYHCSSTVSEMVKLVTNSYLATQLSFWDQVKWLCEAKNLNSHQVARLVALDPRVSSYGPKMHGTSYGHTKCLPKDLTQLIKMGNQAGVDTLLLLAVQMTDLMALAKEMEAKEKACASS